MKVLCINNSNPEDKTELRPESWIWEGEIYTVSGKHRENGTLYYYLEERSFFTNGPVYKASRFMRLSKDPLINTENMDTQSSGT